MAVKPVTNVNTVTQADLDAHSEQALISLVYVKTANDLIGSAMANLDTALSTTQSVLNILQALQNLHNDINVKSKSAFPFLFSTGGFKGIPVTHTFVDSLSPFGAPHYSTVIITGFPPAGPNGGISLDPSSYQAAYNKAASAYFGKPIDPFFAFQSAGTSGYADFRNTLMALKNKLRVEISAVTAQTNVADRNDPGSLLFNITKVYNDLPSNFKFSTVESWAIDDYNQHASANQANAGQLQNDLTFAITSAESLNDTQKESVRSFLFIFQEYYQSAAAVLSSINQSVKDIAQKISQ